MKKSIIILLLTSTMLFTAGCGVYTFSGSTLPAHLKTVDIPLFANKSLQNNIAETITEQISRKVVSSNLLRVVSGRGDATISGTVISYSNAPQTYDSRGYRDVNVTDYAVTITATIEFTDNKSGNAIYKGTITGRGVYDFSTKREEDGVTLAIGEIVDQIIQNSVQSW